jgi:hypothetical protein
MKLIIYYSILLIFSSLSLAAETSIKKPTRKKHQAPTASVSWDAGDCVYTGSYDSSKVPSIEMENAVQLTGAGTLSWIIEPSILPNSENAPIEKKSILDYKKNCDERIKELKGLSFPHLKVAEATRAGRIKFLEYECPMTVAVAKAWNSPRTVTQVFATPKKCQQFLSEIEKMSKAPTANANKYSAFYNWQDCLAKSGPVEGFDPSLIPELESHTKIISSSCDDTDNF